MGLCDLVIVLSNWRKSGISSRDLNCLVMCLSSPWKIFWLQNKNIKENKRKEILLKIMEGESVISKPYHSLQRQHAMCCHTFPAAEPGAMDMSRGITCICVIALALPRSSELISSVPARRYSQAYCFLLHGKKWLHLQLKLVTSTAVVIRMTGMVQLIFIALRNVLGSF